MLNASRHFHTLRHLRPVQLYGRLWYKLYHPKPDLSPPPALRPLAGTWRAPARKPHSLIAFQRFRFLNEEHDILAAADWNHIDWAKLWLYNLHYFDDLNAVNSDVRLDWHQSLITCWIAENHPVAGKGWEPYPISLRIVNWIKWVLAGNELPSGALESLAVQVRYLTRRMEYHLLGNHLFANAKALIFAGFFFDGKEAEIWLEKGLRILAAELPEQILADGGHFELSPMYHSIIFEDLLDLINLSWCYDSKILNSRLRGNDIKDLWNTMIEGDEAEAEKGNNELAETERTPMIRSAKRMLAWLKVMSHPDGQIALFNDAAMEIAIPPADLVEYAERLAIREDSVSQLEQSVIIESGTECLSSGSIKLTHLISSGYIRVENGPMTAILDVAPIGPDYLPGHAHADTLSFELSLFGQRVLVNSGTSQYGNDAERQRQRGTAAHNTVTINGQDSSEVWSGFRVARRARPLDLEIRETSIESIVVRCAHDGYRRLSGKPVHRREWYFENHSLTVYDVIEGRFTKVVGRFHFHPSITLRTMDRNLFSIFLPGGETIACHVQTGASRLVPSTYHPEFGLTCQNQCLEIQLNDNALHIIFNWS